MSNTLFNRLRNDSSSSKRLRVRGHMSCWEKEIHRLPQWLKCSLWESSYLPLIIKDCGSTSLSFDCVDLFFSFARAVIVPQWLGMSSSLPIWFGWKRVNQVSSLLFAMMIWPVSTTKPTVKTESATSNRTRHQQIHHEPTPFRCFIGITKRPPHRTFFLAEEAPSSFILLLIYSLTSLLSNRGPLLLYNLEEEDGGEGKKKWLGD